MKITRRQLRKIIQETVSDLDFPEYSEEYERGFEDAYNASPESKAFVGSLMKKIIDYEYELENANLSKKDE